MTMFTLLPPSAKRKTRAAERAVVKAARVYRNLTIFVFVVGGGTYREAAVRFEMSVERMRQIVDNVARAARRQQDGAGFSTPDLQALRKEPERWIDLARKAAEAKGWTT